MRGWRASLAKGLLDMWAAKLVRTASLPLSRTFQASRRLYSSGTASFSVRVSSGVNRLGKKR